MTFIKKALATFSRDEDGATLVEYGIALGLAITLGAGAMTLLGKDVGKSMELASSCLPGHVATEGGATCPTS